MDSRQNAQVSDQISTIPRIRRRSAEWISAQPSRRLHLGLAAAWMGFLYTIGLLGPLVSSLFTGPSSEPVPAPELGFVDVFALAMFLVTLGGIFSVVSLAITNSKATAPVSAICGLSVIIVGATCGFVGHPPSAWGPNAALAAGIVAASAAVMMRRETNA